MDVATGCDRNHRTVGDHEVEGGTGADWNMWGKARANSGCSKMLEHPESAIAEDFTSIARCGAWATDLC